MTAPKTWVQARLRDACELVNGRAYKQPELLDEGKYRVIRVGNFFSSNKWYFSNLELEAGKYCDSGDLLYAWSASFGPNIWAGEKAIFHYHVWRVRLEHSVVDKMFLYRWFQWDKDNIKAEHGTGSTMIHVTKGDMEARPIALPPLAEQRRIVAKLEALTARTARARADLDRIPALAARYKQAVLQTLVPVPEDQSCPFAEVVREGLIGLVRSKHQQDECEGTPYVRMQHYDLEGVWNEQKLTRVQASAAEEARFALREGDVLFNTRNSVELVGKVAVCTPAQSGFLYNNNLLRLRFRNDVLPRFAFRQMQGPVFRKHLEGQKSATTSVAAIYQGSLFRTPFWVPSIEVQAEIVSRIDKAFAEIDRLTAEAAAARRLLDRLDQAVLARAFRGELVPQDPADEPASVLLDRIRAERTAAPKAKRGRRSAVPA